MPTSTPTTSRWSLRTSTTTKDPKLRALERELDEVVGPYESRAGQRAIERWGRILGRALLGASLAITAVVVIVYVLHHHVRQAQTAPARPAPAKPAPGKAVPVQILPARE